MRIASIVIAVIVLTGCPKKKDGAVDAIDDEVIWLTGDDEPERRVPQGWDHIDLPSGILDIRPNTSLAVEDGSLWIAGSALKIAQYQWVLRASELEEPTQHVYDPGRIFQIASNGTGGISAVGVLGGIPADKAWFGNIDAFGGVSSRQTYLSNGAAQLRGIDAAGDAMMLSGTIANGTYMRGWLISADVNGSDRWKKTYGESGDHTLSWVDERDDETTLIGRFRAEDGTDEAWYLRVDSEGKVEAERHWAPKTWTRLHTAVSHPTGDVLAAGLVSSTELGPDDGDASLWIGRLTPTGQTTWDRFEHTDVSEMTQAVAWKDGLALVVRTGAIGAHDRGAWLVRASADGVVVWTELNVPGEIDLVEVHAINSDTLQLIVVISDKEGVSWTSYPLVLND